MPLDIVARQRTAPVDETSRAALAARGLEPRLVATDDPDGFAAWLQVIARGFLDGERSPEQIEANRERSGYRRITGIYDGTSPNPDAPVATIASWIAELSLPGGRVIPSCAITAVSVSPTHRRRGIARAMVEGELRIAADLGVPMAMLTVSESTLYGRYGFAPAASSASWRIDVKRAAWIGPEPGGRVDFISREQLRALVVDLHERVRPTVPGEISVPTGHWDTFAGTRPDAKEGGQLRAIQYTDESGVARGLALYRVSENEEDFTKSAVRISYLLSETDDAYASLWRFFIELDLVAEVRAEERAVDEPLLWMISDQRAATVTVRDHQYVRILDVPEVLGARTFGAAGLLALEVDDPIGIAGGRWLLEVDDDGRGVVTDWDTERPPEGATVVALGIAELSAVSLGGVSLATLAAAGRVRTTDAATAARVLGWHVTPRLSIWY